LTAGIKRITFLDIGTVIFSIDPRVVPFPAWRAKPDPGPQERQAQGREPALIITLDRRSTRGGKGGPAPGPSAA
jgi:hypothetical protein